MEDKDEVYEGIVEENKGGIFLYAKGRYCRGLYKKLGKKKFTLYSSGPTRERKYEIRKEFDQNFLAASSLTTWKG